MQEEIAKEVSDKLRLKLTGTEKEQLAKRPTENLKAFQYYMQDARPHQRRTRTRIYWHLLVITKKRFQEDGKYALCLCGPRGCLRKPRILWLHRANRRPAQSAEEAARKALELDDKLAEAHAALGLAYIGVRSFKFLNWR